MPAPGVEGRTVAAISIKLSREGGARFMKAKLEKMIAALDRLVNHFIPAEIAADRDARNRAHVFLVSHILGPFIGNVVPIALYVLDPTPGYQVAVLATSITAFWIFPFLLRAGAPYNPLALVSIQNLTFCILWSCYFYGGVTSPTLPWVLVIPLLAFFYLGSSKRLRLIVMVMFAANLAIFSCLYLFGYPVDNDLPVAAMQGLGLVSTIAASLYVAMMALYYVADRARKRNAPAHGDRGGIPPGHRGSRAGGRRQGRLSRQDEP
jgi:hypothetical protein